VLIEGLVESGKLCDERGVPRMKGRENINVGVVENTIGSNIVRDGGLCIRAEELAFSLKVREFGVTFSLEQREFSEGFAKEVLVKGTMGAERVSNESDAGGNFGGGGCSRGQWQESQGLVGDDSNWL
jgi:hypothetical protein